MSLGINEIFPCEDETMRILEPDKCIKILSYPSVVSETESRVFYRKRISKGSQIFQYKYTNLMNWEYLMIQTFFSRKKGRYEDFYLVDWSSPFRILTVAGGTDYTLDRVTELTATSGFVGNIVLLYNPRFDPKGTATLEDKNILTIDSIMSNTITVTKSEAGRTHLDNGASKIYILVPAIFDSDSLAPDTGDTVIETKNIYFPGYGIKSIFGPTHSINIGFTQLGVLADA